MNSYQVIHGTLLPSDFIAIDIGYAHRVKEVIAWNEPGWVYLWYLSAVRMPLFSNLHTLAWLHDEDRTTSPDPVALLSSKIESLNARRFDAPPDDSENLQHAADAFLPNLRHLETCYGLTQPLPWQATLGIVRQSTSLEMVMLNDIDIETLEFLSKSPSLSRLHARSWRPPDVWARGGARLRK